MRPLAVLAAIVAVAVLALGHESSHAVTGSIFVTTTADGIVDDGDCSLREAVHVAREDVVVDDCSTQAGSLHLPDIILLESGETYTLNAGEGYDAGDLDTHRIGLGPIRIAANPPNAIIDAQGADRVVHANIGGELELSHITLRNGLATGDPQPEGGGIYNQSTLYLEDVVIENNQAFGGGAGIYNTAAGDIHLNRVTVTGNVASGNGTTGGISTGWIAEIANSTISNNHADSTGGIGGLSYFGDNQSGDPRPTSVTIADSTFSGNTGGAVGAIQNGATIGGSETMSLTNVTVSGNSGGTTPLTGVGGLMLVGTSGPDAVSIVNATIAGNSGGLTDGIHASSGQAVTMLNTIVANGSGATAVNCGGAGAITSLGGNMEADADCTGLTDPTDAQSADALLGTLQNNGGLTETHALLTNSPAINTGVNAGCPDHDQRGEDRPVGSACDRGAYESDVLGTFTPTPSPTASPTQTFSPTDTVQPSSTPTIAPTETPAASDTATPTSTPQNTATQGSLDCDSLVEVGDAFELLLFAGGLPGPLELGCDIAIGAQGWGGFAWGDVNCDGVVDASDALLVMVAAASVDATPGPTGCVPIGDEITRIG